MSFLRSFLCAAFVLALTIAGPTYAQDFLKSGIKMGTIGCPESDYICNDISSIQNEVIAKSNECIKNIFGIDEAIMTNFSMSGEYENCVMPGKPHKNEADRQVWAVCCLKKIEGETCNLVCTRYITPK